MYAAAAVIGTLMPSKQRLLGKELSDESETLI
jgi:hypothetical protein